MYEEYQSSGMKGCSGDQVRRVSVLMVNTLCFSTKQKWLQNHLFRNLENGADASARCYSIIESGNLNGLNVFGYLSYLLTELPKLGNEPTSAFV